MHDPLLPLSAFCKLSGLGFKTANIGAKPRDTHLLLQKVPASAWGGYLPTRLLTSYLWSRMPTETRISG